MSELVSGGIPPIAEDRGWAMWLAALIDGEGCLSVKVWRGHRRNDGTLGNAAYRPRITIHMASRRVIDRAAWAIGGSQRVHRTPRPGNWRTTYRVEWFGDDAVSVLTCVLPHLIEKQGQALLLMALATSSTGTGKTRTAEEVAYQASLYEAVKKLNQRGHDDLDRSVDVAAVIAGRPTPAR